MKKEIVAMILAGGQGSRLKMLTKNIAKPAVPFGGKYRIIDFALSNCSNSGLETVGVLTQYKPQVLNSHIGIGSPWDLDRYHGGVSLLPPYMRESGGDWYKGTANAIYQNLDYLDSFDPEYVLILSGDHIYKMDYSRMLKFHKEKNADATIAVINVPEAEACRFGIMNTDDTYKVLEFQEKPENPKSTKASMGIYIFNYRVLKKFLIQDEKDKKSSNDFGKNIIPKMLSNNQKLFAYPFEGYWKDVGTIDSLWEAHMDLLKPTNELNLFDSKWKIYSENISRPSQYIGANAKVENSLISEGCTVLGEVVNSVVFPGVYIGENSKVMNSIIMSDVKIEKNVIIDKSIITDKIHIKKNNVVGNSKDIVLIGEDNISESCVTR